MNQLNTRPGFTPAPDNEDPFFERLDGDLVYENDKYIIRVYAGYKSSGSIPRWLWSILGVTPNDPRCKYGWAVHDLLYQAEYLKRSINDVILYEILSIPPRCNLVQRQAILRAVQCFGWWTYRQHTRTSIAEARKFGEVVYKGKLRGVVK